MSPPEKSGFTDLMGVLIGDLPESPGIENLELVSKSCPGPFYERREEAWRSEILPKSFFA
jgi:hypothetical protein